jgi:ADP-L-glycero-D-manno-heptose 6-epimerase
VEGEIMRTKIYDDQLIVVTGAAGFIGSAVVKQLNDQGLSNLVLVDDIGKTDKWKNLIGKKYVELISIDQLFTWLEGKERLIEAFIHLGACSDTLEKDGSYMLENNLQYSIRLALYALTHGHRFIYASSASSYGDGSLGFSDNHALLDQLRPLNLYAFSKHSFDLWLLRQGALDQVVGMKYFNVFGPNENEKGHMASMVYRMLPSAQNEGVIRLFKSYDPKLADGEQSRDFLYVKDAARITCQFLENDFRGIINVGRGHATTWNQLAKAVFQAIQKEPHIEYIHMPPELAKQYQNYTCADITKYLKTFGKQPAAFSIESSVTDYIQNYLLKDTRW